MLIEKPYQIKKETGGHILQGKHIADMPKWELIGIAYFFNFFKEYQHIYIESMHYSGLLELYKRCVPAIPIEILAEDSFIDGSQSILIWESDSHEELICEKISCAELYQCLHDETIRSLQRGIMVKNDWGWVKIEEKDLTHELAVAYFDQGNATICVVNEKQEFLYALCQGDMQRNYLFSDILKRRDLFVNKSDDVLRDTACIFYEANHIEEIPVLENQKVVASAIRRQRRKQVLRWEWIEEETVAQIWNKGAKLLVSSLNPDIQGFVDRFTDFYDIEVYCSELYEKYLSGKYVALIYSEEIWVNSLTAKYNIKQLYLDCLANDMLRWLEQNQISYHYFAMPWGGSIYRFNKRWVSQSTISGDNIEINGCYFQKDVQKEGFHVYGGRRVTIGEPDTAEHTIYVYGPCIAIGSFVVDEDTIESKLQLRLNDMHLNYRVVNCGGGNSPYEVDNDINSFYMMVNTKFKPGDMIVHFGATAWKNAKLPSLKNYHSCSEAFNMRDVQHEKCFSAGVAAHLNATGNRILERFVFSKIEKELKNNMAKDTGFVSYREGEKQVDNDSLRVWLKELCKNKTNYDNVGCIVMNCNPFTKGHFYLIEQSRKEVEYLYVFVVEEDQSDFPFKERYEMVVKNCAWWNNVKVIPSGKYIISSLTFEEYFNKDNLQEETIFPAMDIQLFAKYVAPALNITVRFVGEEITDKVTAQYNKAMKELLPLDGIKVVEYPRYAEDGEVVSASKVRKCIADKDWGQLKKYLTDETYQYVIEKYK